MKNRNKKFYSLTIFSALGWAIAALALVTISSGAVQTIATVLTGSMFGLAGALMIQEQASEEQTDMVRAVTLDAEGISLLPEKFSDLQWIAHATKKPSNSGGEATRWVVTRMGKIGGTGGRFVSYSLTVSSLMSEPVSYVVTFVGAQATVVGFFSREHERTSVATFDTSVSAAGVHFGVAYLTDWTDDRDVTLMIVGTGQLSEFDISALPSRVVEAFHEWYEDLNIEIESAHESLMNEHQIIVPEERV